MGHYVPVLSFQLMFFSIFISILAIEAVLSQGLGSSDGILQVLNLLSSDNVDILKFVTGIIESVCRINPLVVINNGGIDRILSVDNYEDSVKLNIFNIFDMILSYSGI